MASRAIGTGMVSFGLVSIPVKLFSATDASSGVSFNMLHDKCKTRLKQQYVCPTDNEIVSREHTVKGYEFAKDQYVTFTEEEIKALQSEASKSIEIVEFVPAAQVDPVYFDKAYYLGPDKGGDRAYALLGEAMRKTGRSALARWAARGKQYLVLIRAVKGGLVMQQLMYADEVRSIADVPIGETQVKESELALALQLIDQISSEQFKPDSYEDDVKKRILDAIEKKVQGQEVAAPVVEPQAQIIDLMEALKASLSGKAPAAGAPAAADADARKPAKRAPRGKGAPEEKRAASGS
ncbi:MAG: Ku protein [Acidobacteriota bacterium]